MSQFAAALAGALTAVMVGGTAVARHWPSPSGRRRAGRSAPAEELLRPVEALDQFEAYCPAEDRPTLQLRLRLGGTVCIGCHNPTATTTGDAQ
ncbi:hypothetical protein [Streptomyces broussonetiae]|uniref:Uncharacterized protein n=1 Tax=Streptomyces broussonetiae TaxID=2686304 RepID=A0ABV5E5L8_9ACTN